MSKITIEIDGQTQVHIAAQDGNDYARRVKRKNLEGNLPMKNQILFLSLCATTLTSAAGWVKVEGDSSATFFYDPTTISSSGDIANVMVLMDFPPGRGDLGSSSSRYEFNCRTKEMRIRTTKDFKGRMGTRPIGPESESPTAMWSEMAGSLNGKFWKLTCKGTQVSDKGAAQAATRLTGEYRSRPTIFNVPSSIAFIAPGLVNVHFPAHGVITSTYQEVDDGVLIDTATALGKFYLKRNGASLVHTTQKGNTIFLKAN